MLVLRWGRPRLCDGALAVALAGLAFIPALAQNPMDMGELPQRPLDAVAVVAVLAQCLPLAVRRRWPAACLAVVTAGFAVQQLRGYAVFTAVAVIVALYSVGAHQDRFRRGFGVVFTIGYASLALALHHEGSPERPVDFVTFYLVLAACWVVGGWMRSARAGEAERQRLAAEAARAAERATIARELHDVVTHHVTAMVVQTDAAQYLTGSPDRLNETLTAVSATGRRALDELRNLLDVLGSAPHDRAPAVGRVRDLVEQVRAAGQPIELAEVGSPRPAAGGPEMAAYRVVQESLTNALKYAPGGRTLVSISYRDDSIDVEVTDDGAPGPVPPVGGAGRGLAGLRERVAVFGGDVSAGARDGGGFMVRARIPTGGRP